MLINAVVLSSTEVQTSIISAAEFGMSWAEPAGTPSLAHSHTCLRMELVISLQFLVNYSRHVNSYQHYCDTQKKFRVGKFLFLGKAVLSPRAELPSHRRW